MTSRRAPELEAWWAETRAWCEAHLEAACEGLTGWPPQLAEAARYSLLGGGKRLRPTLVRLFTTSLGGEPDAAVPGAVAVEMVHTYSLIHDDLPCMDDDDLRRGRPTCHKVYGEAMAVLVGDALLTEAFAVLSRGPAPAEATRLLACAAGGAGMVGGQVLDMSLLGSESGLEEVERVHRAKTAELLAVACELGALAAGADVEQRGLARRFGLALGLGFQAVDDILDFTGDAATLGKTPGKDLELDRATSATVLGLEAARERAEAQARAALDTALLLGFDGEHRVAQLVRALVQRES